MIRAYGSFDRFYRIIPSHLYPKSFISQVIWLGIIPSHLYPKSFDLGLSQVIYIPSHLTKAQSAGVVEYTDGISAKG